MSDALLTLNAGSSSVKLALFAPRAEGPPELISRGSVESIGDSPHFSMRGADGTVLEDRRWPTPGPGYDSLLGSVVDWAESHLGDSELIAVGHRVVHGGRTHHAPERVTPELLTALDALTPLAPLHQPHNLEPIRLIAGHRPDLPQVACFDTAFHHTMPPVATRFALPRRFEASGVRRYGFHGLSYEYIARQLARRAPDLAAGRVIVAHLGNGASLCALDGGRSIDTTMGMTALDGLVMGTRCGAIDPGVILYLQATEGLGTAAVQDMLYKQSGLLGVSGGLASDMRTLEASDDPEAEEAIALFVYRIAREIGGLASSLGGLDGLVFTAGIGEHAPKIRARVCAALAWLGVTLDRAANDTGETVISAPEGRVAVMVIPTDEEAMIAIHTAEVIGRGGAV